MVGVMPDPMPPEAPVARVTLTRSAIQSARSIVIVLTGDRKRAILEQAIKDGDSSPYPVGRVLAGLETPVDIHWCAG
jgi:6-phosphogluconolactonase